MLRALVVATESAGTTCCIVRRSGATVFILAGIAGDLDPHLVAVDRLASLALYTYHTIGSRFSQSNWLSYSAVGYPHLF